MISLSVSSQALTSKVWVNSDHQTLQFANDTAVFRNAGREEVFGYTLVADQLTLIGAKALDYKVSVSGDSLKLSKWEGEGALKKKTADGDDYRPQRLMKLGDYDKLTFADVTSLIKPYDDFESIQFRSNACMGTCPVLEITINKGREVYFKADAYADHLGEYSAQLDKAQMRQICELVKEGDLFDLKSRLKTPLDFPTYYLTIDYGNEKTSYSGYFLYEPLNQLVQQFLDFDTTLKLKKLE